MTFLRILTLALLGATLTSDSRAVSVMAAIGAIVYILLTLI